MSLRRIRGTLPSKALRRSAAPPTLWLVVAFLCSTACITREGGEAAAGSAALGDGAPLPGGASLLGSKGVEALEVQGEADKVSVKVVDVEGQSFSRALRATIKEGSDSEWSVQAQAPTSASVEAGDAVLATFYVRVVEELEEGGGETQFVFERAGAPYTKSVSYPLWLTPEWRKVEVRFQAAESYEAGKAQVIFRLGYEPETIEVGGLSVQSFGKEVPLARLPTTEAADKKLLSRTIVAPPLPVVPGGELEFVVDPDEVVGPISPYVYGLNSQKLGTTRATVRRNGGNRGSVYNWELNASNAGSDWHHTNDDWPCTTLGYRDCDEPAAQFLRFFEENREAGAETIVTLPMLDYVSADKKGDVEESEKAPSKRFARSHPKKPGPFAATPDLRDSEVYQDEFVDYLVKKHGKASQGGVRFYSLDNEPALWPSTHPRVHPKPTTYEEVVKRSEATASAVLDVDPTAFILGGVMFGWSEYLGLQSAPDSDKYNETYGTYVDFFLASMAALERKHRKRLVHALDVHWYPEARGTKRITLEDASRKTVDARLQAPRSLWDPDYKERSFITEQTGKPIALIGWLRSKIDKRYPGTKLAMTEYNYGATTHISGCLAQVDALGVFGREGVYLATYWGKGAGVDALPSYVSAAFKLYRNYDGKGAAFGDTAVTATSSDDDAASIFAATDSKQPGRLTIIVVNKDQQKKFDGRIQVGARARCNELRTFGIDREAPAVRALSGASFEGGELHAELPPLTATLFVCEKR
jgi:hypothetical protein